MLIDWPTEFDRWLDRLSDRAEAGAEQAIARLARTNAAMADVFYDSVGSRADSRADAAINTYQLTIEGGGP